MRAGGDLCFAADGDNRYHAILGGSRCYMVHPSDVAPALVALGARARIAGPGGVRVTPFEEFFLPPGLDASRENMLGPADILTDILLPPSPAGWASTYRRASEPGSGYALAGVAAAALVIERSVAEVSVVLGAAAPVPWRSREAEAQLIGREPAPRARAGGRRRGHGRRRAAGGQPLQGGPVQVPAGGVAGGGVRAQAVGLSMPCRMMPAISPTTSSVLLP